MERITGRQAPRVPLAEYVAVFVLAGLFALGLAVARKIKSLRRDEVSV